MGLQLGVSNQTMDPTHLLTQKSANLMPVAVGGRSLLSRNQFRQVQLSGTQSHQVEFKLGTNLTGTDPWTAVLLNGIQMKTKYFYRLNWMKNKYFKLLKKKKKIKYFKTTVKSKWCKKVILLLLFIVNAAQLPFSGVKRWGKNISSQPTINFLIMHSLIYFQN